MKAAIAIAFFGLAAGSLVAQNSSTTWSPITMEQLMRDLSIQGGNFEFKFDRPVFARVTTSVSNYPDGKKTETLHFSTEKPQRSISLYFTAQPFHLGQPPRGDQTNFQEMKVRLSGCSATEGTRLISYIRKFNENQFRDSDRTVSMYQPAVADKPQLETDYILHWYFREGDPYFAKATIRFSDSPFE